MARESLDDKLYRVGCERRDSDDLTREKARELRKLVITAHERGMPKTDIAIRAGLSRVTVHDWTRDDR